MRTLDKILSKVNGKFGAPMGRCGIGVKPDNKRIYDSKIQLTEGYDKGGAYWGIGSELRVSYTKDLSYINFYRRVY